MNPTGTVGALAYWAAEAITRPLSQESRRAGAGMKSAGMLAGRCCWSAAGAPALARRRTMTSTAGRYQAILGDCDGCHTAPAASLSPAALALQTPFGKMVTPNITPGQGHRHRQLDAKRISAARCKRGHRAGRQAALSGHALSLLCADERCRYRRAVGLSARPSSRCATRSMSISCAFPSISAPDGGLELALFQARRRSRPTPDKSRPGIAAPIWSTARAIAAPATPPRPCSAPTRRGADRRVAARLVRARHHRRHSRAAWAAGAPTTSSTYLKTGRNAIPWPRARWRKRWRIPPRR